MFAPDLFFNVSVLLVDLLVFHGTSWVDPHGKPRVRLSFWALLYFLLPFLLALLSCLLWNHRLFAMMRFAGMTLFGHLPPLMLLLAWRRPYPRAGRALASATASLLLVTYVYAYHIEPTWLEITYHRYTHPLLHGLARPVTIVQITDIQTDHVGEYEERVLAEVARLRPDLVVMLGDYIHTWTREEYDREAARLRDLIARSGIAPPLGSFAVEGDSDLVSDWNLVFEGLDVERLNDRTVILQLPGCRINVIGVSQARCRARAAAELAPAIAGRDPALLDLYLAHSPDFVDALPPDRPFLALAGHTHGGQVQLPFVGPPVTLSRLPRRYADDFLPFGAGHLSVTRGIGLEREDAPRLRFLCRPEIRVITLDPP